MPLAKSPRPKCIVMPFQEADAGGIGLALHFLLGNVMAVHTGFAECWFGWRADRIFTTADALGDYFRMQGALVDRQQISKEQKIRCWVYGQVVSHAVRLSFFDGQQAIQPDPESFSFNAEDHLIAFRRQFITYLSQCGLPMAVERQSMALWPERTSLEGLRLFGRALEKFYLYATYGGQGDIDVRPFETAAEEAPESFMAHDLLGWVHYRNQNAAAAKGSFHHALALNPDSPAVMAGLMWCALLEKDQEATVHWAVQKAAKLEEDVLAAAEKARNRFE